MGGSLEEEESLESVLDEIPHQLVAWMNNNYDHYDSAQELFCTSSSDNGFVQECGGGGGSSRSGHVLYDDSGLYSFPPPPPGNTANVVGGGGGGIGGLCPPNSVSMPGFGGVYDGRNNMSGGLSDDDELYRHLNRMGVRDDGVEDVDFIGFPFPDDRCLLNDRVTSLPNGVYEHGESRHGCSGYGSVAAGVSQSGYLGCAGGGMRMMSPAPALSDFHKGHFSDDLFPHQMYPARSDPLFPPPMGYRSVEEQGQAPYTTYGQQVSPANLSNTFNVVYRPDALYYTPKSRMNFNGGDGILEAPNLQQVMMHQRPLLSISCEQQCRLLPNRSPVPLNSTMPQGGLQDINHEGSFILQGQGLKPEGNKNLDCLRRHVNGFINGSEGIMPKGNQMHQVRTSRIHGTHEWRQNQHMCGPAAIPQKLHSLSKVYGQLPDVAKHQTQCRLLQDIIEQRNPQAIQAIFDEIIEHVVELMINPFGNYFMQKLLDVCSEEQRTKIIDMAAREPGVLVRVSMNDHGTRVIQKLIETAKTKEQILKIISALEPGFYALITDSNGNHVIEECLHCFTNEQNKLMVICLCRKCKTLYIDPRHDSCPIHICDTIPLHYSQCVFDTEILRLRIEPKSPECILMIDGIEEFLSDPWRRTEIKSALLFFIFVAAIEYCIEIATDQFGCCVLQKCIGHSTRKYRDRLVAEISNNALLLSQDAFGNYAVQFILDMKNPLYTSRLISQFQGNYVHLAMQKCSSHVVEKCLKVFNSPNKSQLINELLFFNHFEQLLQDPHANYVIQTALKVSEGAVHQRLVHKIELYRAILRHNPYSKRIFSSKKKK